MNTATDTTVAASPIAAAAPVASTAGSAELMLVASARAGDARACEQIVRQHAPRMLAVARKFLPCDDDCNDAVQDAFISAFRRMESFAGQAALSTWLHRITVNACLMKLRKRRTLDEVSIESLLPRFKEDGHYASRVANVPDRPDTAAEWAETRAHVRACIDLLPESYRTVLLLRDIEELNTEETAKLLDTTEGNIKTRLHRARQALRTLLTQ